MSKIKVNEIENRTGSTLTLGKSGTTIQMACGATQTGFGRTGTVNWVTTKKTASFTATSGEGYFCDTAAVGAFTLTLPSSPSAGDIVGLKDYNGNFATANLTIGRGGSPINGVNAADVPIKTAGASIFLVYVDATQGWVATQDDSSTFAGNSFITATGGTITTCGNDKIHTFTSSGTFCVSGISSCAPLNTVSYTVVAGGGGGGGSAASYSGAGGGAGGFREFKSSETPYTASPLNGNPGGTAVTVTAAAFPVTIGAGGAGGGGSPNSSAAPNRSNGTDGSPAVFSTVTSTGGGGGSKSGADPGAVGSAGNPGGSGGGRGGYSNAPSVGQGNTPPVSPPQGNNGGGGDAPNQGFGGGGGGATAVGTSSPASPTHGVPGGAGATTSINASAVTYATGGPAGGPGTEAPEANNTGNGGSGGKFSSSGNAGNGGSGVVILRYRFQ